MEVARWDDQTGCIMDSRFKELFPLLPIIYILGRLHRISKI